MYTKRRSKQLIVLGITWLALVMVASLGMAQPAYAQPPSTPHQFYGTVAVSGSPAAAGTSITAQIGGITYASTAVDSQGKYGYSPLFLIPPDNPDTPAKDGGVNGNTIQFFVGGTAAQTYTFANGGITKLPLSVGGSGGGTPPSAPTLSSPADTATGVATTPNLQWNASSGATSYQAQVSTASNFSITIFNQSGITATQVTVSPALNSSTTYYWRVNAANSSGTSGWSSVRSFTTVASTTPPSAPALSAPANTATGVTTTPSLQWSAPSGAISYQAQISTASNFSTTIFNQSGITATQVTVSPALNNSTTYYWRVNAANSSGTSDWSSVWSFTTAASGTTTTPSAPTLSSPADTATGATTTPSLQWSASSGATSYQVQVSTAGDFGTTVFNQSGITATQVTVSPALNSSTTYYWRANAANSSGTSGWSTIWGFTTTSGTTTPPSPPPQPPPPAGGTSISTTILGTTSTINLSSAGALQSAAVLASTDGTLTLSLKANTTVTIQGQLLTVTAEQSPPAPPADTELVAAYKFNPSQTTFNPAIALSFKYDPAALPAGVAESNLYIAYWDGSSWTALSSTVDSQSKIVTTQISHFSVYAILGTVGDTPPPMPANIKIADLKISPTSVKPGKQVTITAKITNTGGSQASYDVVLNVNGISEAEKEVILEAGKTKEVTFKLSKDKTGSYEITVGDKSASFTVSESATGSTGPGSWSWLMIGALALGCLIVLVIVAVFIRKMASR